MVIIDYYNSLTKDQKKIFRDKVLEETGISLPSFYYKVRNDVWRKSEQTIVDKIINEIVYVGEN